MDTFRVAGSCFGFFALVVVGLIGPPVVAGDLVGMAGFAVLSVLTAGCQVGAVSGQDVGFGLTLLLQVLGKVGA